MPCLSIRLMCLALTKVSLSCALPCLTHNSHEAFPCLSITLRCHAVSQHALSCALHCLSREPLHVEGQSDSEYENEWDLELMEDGVIMTTVLTYSEWVSECVSGWVSGWVSEWVCECVGEWVCEWVCEWVRECVRWPSGVSWVSGRR